MYTQITHLHQWAVLQKSLYHPSLTLHKHTGVTGHLQEVGKVQISVPPSHLHVIYQGSINQHDKQQPCTGKLFQSFHEPIMMTNVQPYQKHTFSDQSHFVHRSQSISHTEQNTGNKNTNVYSYHLFPSRQLKKRKWFRKNSRTAPTKYVNKKLTIFNYDALKVRMPTSTYMLHTKLVNCEIHIDF